MVNVSERKEKGEMKSNQGKIKEKLTMVRK